MQRVVVCFEDVPGGWNSGGGLGWRLDGGSGSGLPVCVRDRGRVELVSDGEGEPREVSVTDDPSELLLRVQYPGGGPA